MHKKTSMLPRVAARRRTSSLGGGFILARPRLRRMTALAPGTHAFGARHASHHAFDATVQRARDELQKEGFGVLTEIDVQATLKKKLDAEFPRYLILGACNPVLARDALTAAPDVGLLLPCNVVVRETSGGVEISALRPTIMFDALLKDARVAPLARDAEARLTRAIERAAE